MQSDTDTITLSLCRPKRSGKARARSGAVSYERVGRFFFRASSATTPRARKILEQIDRVCTDDFLRTYIVGMNDLARRTLDFALTNAFKRRVCLMETGDDPHAVYVREQSMYHREYYDIFRRGERVYFELDGIVHFSTVSQLQLMHAMNARGVVEFVHGHIDYVHECKRQALAMPRSGGKRAQLTQRPHVPFLLRRVPELLLDDTPPGDSTPA